MITKNLKNVKLNCKGGEWYLEYTKTKDVLLAYKYLCCHRNYQKMFDEVLKKQFANTYKLSNNINKFILLLWKSAYPHQCMGDWVQFNETSLPEKEDFYSNLNIKGLLMQTTGTWKEFGKHLI